MTSATALHSAPVKSLALLGLFSTSVSHSAGALHAAGVFGWRIPARTMGANPTADR